MLNHIRFFVPKPILTVLALFCVHFTFYFIKKIPCCQKCGRHSSFLYYKSNIPTNTRGYQRHIEDTRLCQHRHLKYPQRWLWIVQLYQGLSLQNFFPSFTHYQVFWQAIFSQKPPTSWLIPFPLLRGTDRHSISTIKGQKVTSLYLYLRQLSLDLSEC